MDEKTSEGGADGQKTSEERSTALFEEVGRRLRAAREARGLTLAQVARRVGYPAISGPEWLERMEQGREWVSHHQLYAVAETLGVEGLEHLLGLRGAGRKAPDESPDRPTPTDAEAVRREQRKRVYEVIGWRLRLVRESRGLTCKALGALVGMEASRVDALERSSRWARVHELYLLAEALEVEPARLVPTWAELAEETLEERKAQLPTKERWWQDAWRELFEALGVGLNLSPRRSLQALVEAARKLRARAEGAIPAGEKPPFIRPSMVLVNPSTGACWKVEVIEASPADDHGRVFLTRSDDPMHSTWMLVKDLESWVLAEPFVMKAGEPKLLSGEAVGAVPAGSKPPYLAVGMKLRHPDTAAVWVVLALTEDFAQLGCGKCIMWMESRTLLNWSLAEWFQTHEMKIQAKSSTPAPPASPHVPDEGVLPAGRTPPYLSQGMVLVEPRGEHHVVRVIEGENVILRETRGGWISSRKSFQVAAWPLAEPFDPSAHAGAAQPAKTSPGNLNTPEPAPKPNGSRPIWDLVIEDMKARDAAGRAKYGVPLQAHNGRNPLVDAYQEGLDQVAYLRQAIEEGRGGVSTPMQGVPPVWRVMGPKSVYAGRERLVKLFRDRVQAIYCLAEERGRGGSGGLVFERSDDAGETWVEEDPRWAPEEKTQLSGEQTSVGAPAASSTPQPASDDENGDFSQQGGGA